MNFEYRRNHIIKIKRLDRVKADLKAYDEEMKLFKEIREEIKELRSGITDLRSGISNTDPVQGGGSSQEDRYSDTFDKIMENERLLKLIDLDTRAIKDILHNLDEEEFLIVDSLRIKRTSSLRQLEPSLYLLKDTIKRRSDKILLYIYEELYVKTPKEVYPV